MNSKNTSRNLNRFKNFIRSNSKDVKEKDVLDKTIRIVEK